MKVTRNFIFLALFLLTGCLSVPVELETTVERFHCSYSDLMNIKNTFATHYKDIRKSSSLEVYDLLKDLNYKITRFCNQQSLDLCLADKQVASEEALGQAHMTMGILQSTYSYVLKGPLEAAGIDAQKASSKSFNMTMVSINIENSYSLSTVLNCLIEHN